jgi:hypothetical protein
MEIGLHSDSTFIVGDSLEYYNFLNTPSMKNLLIERIFKRYVKKEDVIVTKKRC